MPPRVRAGEKQNENSIGRAAQMRRKCEARKTRSLGGKQESMAKKETITVGPAREAAVNIHFSVGQGGDNGPADVMLIQTLFHYLCHIQGTAMRNVGFSLGEVPEITGRCCAKTKQAIAKFQYRNAHRLLRTDGVIHPASYEGRRIRPGEPKYMTMTLLHFLATEMQLFHPEPSYIDTLIKMVPRLRPWLA